MHRFAAFVSTLVVLTGLFAVPACAERRVALVLGNSGYQHAPRLKNPINDATDIAATLQRLGFDVVRGLDLDYAGMRQQVKAFSDKLIGAQVALVFYAGHGLQVAGKNYLVPVDAEIQRPADLDFATVDLDLIMHTLDGEPRTNLIFLDACRDNPFAQNLARSLGTRSASVGRGLAQVESGVGTLIAYATKPGDVARDGEGRNSPFTSALLETVERPGLSIGEVMIEVRNEVLKSTGGNQVTWDHSSLTGPFYFTPQRVASPDASAQDSLEVAFWNSIRVGKNPRLFQAYLQRYPNGAFADIARINLEQAKTAAARPIIDEPAGNAAISDPGLLREVHDRLYELNFDPPSTEPADMRTAIREFESQSKLPPTGEATDGLLRRLRELGGLKPWGAIVYATSGRKWGMSWDQSSRHDAVAAARAQCGQARCLAEISFFGTECGAFALSSASWAIVARDDVARAKQAALDDCGKRGKACRIIAAGCADGAGRN
jgi:hypothetical protein